MATKTTASTRTTKAAAKTVTPQETGPVSVQQEEKKPLKAKDVDIHEYIPVKNGFQGLLIYISKRTGEEFQWERFGDEQEMELQELKNAKSSSKGFFQNNWFLFDDEYQWVIDWLGVRNFYRNALRDFEFDTVFTKTPEEIREIVGKLSGGQKQSLEYRARQMIADGEIDSNKAIAALEEALGVKLSER